MCLFSLLGTFNKGATSFCCEVRSRGYVAVVEMMRRELSLLLFVGFLLGSECGTSQLAFAEQPSRGGKSANASERNSPEQGQELNRLSKQENALLGADKQSPQKTIEGLSAQVQVMQMQQDKLVEELLKYRRMAREGKRPDAAVPVVNTDPATPADSAAREEAVRRAQALEDENTALRAELEKTKKQVADQQQKIQDQEQLVAGTQSLRKQLQEARNQLLMKQTEMQVLGKASPNMPVANATPPKMAVNDATKQKIFDEVMERSGRIAGEESVKGKPSSEALIVEVRGVKVNLRSGAGNEHAPVMQVQKGTRLTVEERVGDWYRVITPTGNRAYILAEVVTPIRPDGSGRAVAVEAPGVGRRPSKQVARAALDDNLEPFGNVSPGGVEPGRAGMPKDDFDKAFQKLKKGPSEENAGVPEQE